MTAIAWAIVFVALIFYERIYIVQIELKKYSDTVGCITFIALIMVFICTIRDLFR